jgi:hypothetical protein
MWRRDKEKKIDLALIQEPTLHVFQEKNLNVRKENERN